MPASECTRKDSAEKAGSFFFCFARFLCRYRMARIRQSPAVLGYECKTPEPIEGDEGWIWRDRGDRLLRRSRLPTTPHSFFIALTLDGFSLPLTREVAQLVCDGGRDCIGRIDSCVSSRRHFSPSVSFADTLRQREPIRTRTH